MMTFDTHAGSENEKKYGKIIGARLKRKVGEVSIRLPSDPGEVGKQDFSNKLASQVQWNFVRDFIYPQKQPLRI